MPRYEASIEINRAPEEVYDYIADLRRHPEWAGNDLRIEPLSKGSELLGARFRSRGHQGGIDVVDELAVIEHARPARFAFEAAGKEGRMLHTFTIIPAGSGVRLTKSMAVLETPFLLRLLTPFFSVWAPRNLARDLRRIKARLDAQASGLKDRKR